jgi:hypothetical protein
METGKVNQLFKRFRSTYDEQKFTETWRNLSTDFRKLWQERVLLNKKVKISESEIDDIVRIVDRHGKGNTGAAPAVAHMMVTQGQWHKMFTDLHADRQLANKVDVILNADNLQIKEQRIDELYNYNKNKNRLTTDSANTINGFLAAYSPDKHVFIVSLNDREKIIDYFGFTLPENYPKLSIGQKITVSQTAILEGFKKLGINESPLTISQFCYFPVVKELWRGYNRKFYVVGSRYLDEQGRDTNSKIKEFIKGNFIAIGFIWAHDFSEYMGAHPQSIGAWVEKHYDEEKPVIAKVKGYFRLFSRLRAGDIIAVKSQGRHNKLTIIAYAEVIEIDGIIYEHKPDELGHHIKVKFLDKYLSKKTGLTRAGTIHVMNPKKNEDDFHKVFGWYTSLDQPTPEDEIELEEATDSSGYNEKSEEGYERSATEKTKVQLLHNKIQNAFIRYLKMNYSDDICFGERERVDAKRVSKADIYIYEIKPFESVYHCIRTGIGQLLDYCHQQSSRKKTMHIVIVGEHSPKPQDLAFINFIRKSIDIDFIYIAFNVRAQTAKEF